MLSKSDLNICNGVGINNSGQILLEVLVAMSVAAIVMVLGSQLVYVSLVGNKISGDNNVASGLTEETFEALRAVSTENWDNIYSLTHGSTSYHPSQSAGKWILAADAETVPLNLITYSRFFTVQNVCRDISTRAISGVTENGGSTEICPSGNRHDPSTQKINVTVSWPGGASAADSEFLTRWRNKVCVNTDWLGGKTFPVDNAVVCSESISTYYNDDGNIDVNTVGIIKLKSL